MPSSVVKVEAQKEVAVEAAAKPAAGADALNGATKAAAPTSVTPIVHLRSIRRSLTVEEASKMAVQLAKEQTEETRKMAEARCSRWNGSSPRSIEEPSRRLSE